jgi:hypothetical protein
MMILGLSFGFATAASLYTPWTDPVCLSFVYAGQAQTVVSTRTTVVPNLLNPGQTFTVPSGQGPTLDTSIGGKPTWVADATLTTRLTNANIPIPAINNTGSSLFSWSVGRFDASSTGGNTIVAAGTDFQPSIFAQYSSAGISAMIGGISRTVTSGAGYVQGTAKRMIGYHSGTDVADYMLWGSISSGAGGTSTTAAQSGASMFCRRDGTEPSQGAIGAYGLFTATGANAAARVADAAATIAKIDAWAAAYYGGAWAALIS